MRLVFKLLAISLVVTAISPAHALFGDDEARKAILDLRAQVNAQQTAQMNLLDRLEKMSRELSQLRGQVESLNNELRKEQRRSQDLYGDVAERLQKVEPKAKVENVTKENLEEKKDYDSAISSFRSGAYAQAITKFNAFIKKHKNSKLIPQALYWLGNSYFGQGDYARAISTERQVVSRYPKNPLSAEALLTMAASQYENKETSNALASYKQIVQKYPKTDAAKLAREKIKELDKK